MQLSLEQWPAPLATLLLVTDKEGMLRALEFADHEPRMHRFLHMHYGVHVLRDGQAPPAIKRCLSAYFGGDLNALGDIPVATGGTQFQRTVWKALRTIPAGTTMSYGQLAVKIGRDRASRAVGAANGANPIAIVVPCHRVIGADGTLTGYGGGLPHKRWLLDHERRFAGQGVEVDLLGAANEANVAERLTSPSLPV
jgi:O-6-methylguanine DNA methyltransferase